ncbi:MAG TPA: 2-hydroxyacid dehydrogenase [Cyclobacteriaceae bacterium]|nr:2-hydroxyacid dehydrogenase [Cyclobacteriaceae bacterium]
MNHNIAFFDAKPYDKETFNLANSEFHFHIKYFHAHLTDESAVMSRGYDVVCAFVNDLITADIIGELVGYGVRLIALRCAGYSNVDLKAAYERIHILRVPAYSPYAIAEHTAALILTLNRKIHRAYNRTREANFALSGLMGFDLHGKTAGVVGTGNIGKNLVRILRGFGMNVLVYDILPDYSFAKDTNCRYTELDELFASSDIISLNCPLTRETGYMVNRDSISRMKDGVMVINTGRGKLIKTSDLIDALKTGKVGSAGLDVYEEESEYFFEDLSDRVLTDDILARLLTFNNVIITSHQGYFTREALEAIARTTILNISDFFEGKALPNEICYRCPAMKESCRKEIEGRCF